MKHTIMVKLEIEAESREDAIKAVRRSADTGKLAWAIAIDERGIVLRLENVKYDGESAFRNAILEEAENAATVSPADIGARIRSDSMPSDRQHPATHPSPQDMNPGTKLQIDNQTFVVTSVFGRTDTYFVRLLSKLGKEYGRFTILFRDRDVWRFGRQGRIVHVSL